MNVGGRRAHHGGARGLATRRVPRRRHRGRRPGARHGSEEFRAAAAEVLAAEDFDVVLLPRPLPTPTGGVRGTPTRRGSRRADHRIAQSAADRIQGVRPRRGHRSGPRPTARIEDAIANVERVGRAPVTPVDDALVTASLERVASLPFGDSRDIRIALTTAARRRWRDRGGRPARGGVHRHPHRGRAIRTRSRLSPPSRPEPRGTRRHGRTARARGVRRRRRRDRTRPRPRPLRGRVPGPDGWRMLTGTNRRAARRSDPRARLRGTHWSRRTIVSSTLLGRSPRPADFVPPAPSPGSSGSCAPARAGLRVRGGRRALRRPAGRARQGRHLRGRADRGPGRRPRGGRAHSRRCPRRPRRALRRPRHRPVSAPFDDLDEIGRAMARLREYHTGGARRNRRHGKGPRRGARSRSAPTR